MSRGIPLPPRERDSLARRSEDSEAAAAATLAKLASTNKGGLEALRGLSTQGQVELDPAKALKLHHDYVAISDLMLTAHRAMLAQETTGEAEQTSETVSSEVQSAATEDPDLEVLSA